MTSLHNLHKKNHDICTCGLKETATQPVFGNGNENAEIVFIGEAPGKEEDREGVPFVGRAGKFLTEILETIEIKREDIYITNTVKYRPPENRDPTPEEKSACLPWLVEELEYIKPKIIILLGRHSLNTFFPGESISEVHGKLLRKKIHFIIGDRKIDMPSECYLPLYHPAAALYNGALRETLVEDMKKIPRILKNI
jgi:uracil-DNA glycosylase family 4